MKMLSPLAQNYADRFETALATLPGAGDRNISALRKAGFEKFSALDFPGKRIEEWRYTNLASLTKGAANEDQQSAPAIQHARFNADYEVVFINGRFSAKDSNIENLPAGVHLTSLADELGKGAVFSLAEDEKRSLVALNTAFMQDGLCLHVADGVEVPGVLAIRFINDADGAEQVHIRNRITLGDGAKLALLEEHEGNGRYFANPVTMISLAKGAVLDHYKYQNESLAAYHIALTDCEIADGATYRNFALTHGARLSRNELKTSILGEDALSKLDGAYQIDGNQHCDTTSLTEHKTSRNVSEQVYKGVISGKAHGVFQGKIHIFPDAQQVSGDQLSKALLLSDDAQIVCKPELEIYADDVKCSHGATSGELDEDALFYLQARGIPAEAAKKMLIEAFLGDVLTEIENDSIRDYFTSLSGLWLERI